MTQKAQSPSILLLVILSLALFVLVQGLQNSAAQSEKVGLQLQCHSQVI